MKPFYELAMRYGFLSPPDMFTLDELIEIIVINK